MAATRNLLGVALSADEAFGLMKSLPSGRGLPGYGNGCADCCWRRGGLPRVDPADHHREAGAGEGGGIRRSRPARTAGGGVAAGPGLSWVVLALAEVIDDAAGFAHPVGAAWRGVAHDTVGERRGGLVEPPGCPPDAAFPVPGLLQQAREDVRGSGDRQRGPGGQRAGEAADPDVQPDLGPVVAGCLPYGRDQVAGGAADGADPLPFGRVPVPAGARLGLGCGVVQRVGDGRVGSVGRPVAAGMLAAGGQPEDVPQVGECRLDVMEAVDGRPGSPRGGGLAAAAGAGAGRASPARPPGWRRRARGRRA